MGKQTTKRACEICGKTVDNDHEKYKAHKVECLKAQEKAKAMRAKNESKTIEDMGLDPDSELAKQIETARKVAERDRAEAPNIEAGIGDGVSPMKRLVQYARKVKLLTELDHEFFCENDKVAEFVTDGYIPVVEGGVHLGHKELRLMKKSQEHYVATQHAFANQSTARVDAALRKGRSTIKTEIDKT